MKQYDVELPSHTTFVEKTASYNFFSLMSLFYVKVLINTGKGLFIL